MSDSELLRAAAKVAGNYAKLGAMLGVAHRTVDAWVQRRIPPFRRTQLRAIVDGRPVTSVRSQRGPDQGWGHPTLDGRNFQTPLAVARMDMTLDAKLVARAVTNLGATAVAELAGIDRADIETLLAGDAHLDHAQRAALFVVVRRTRDAHHNRDVDRPIHLPWIDSPRWNDDRCWGPR